MITLTPVETDDEDSYDSCYKAYLGQAIVEETMFENPRDISGNSLPKITGKEILELCQNGSTIYVQPLDSITQLPEEVIVPIIGNIISLYLIAVQIFDLSLYQPESNGAYLATQFGEHVIIDEEE